MTYHEELDLLAEYMDIWIEYRFYQQMHIRSMLGLARRTISFRGLDVFREMSLWKKNFRQLNYPNPLD